jgi:ethanolamine utilization protein EutQ (cupin superfamily)
MTDRLVNNIPFDSNNTTSWPPLRTDDRHKNSTLTAFGPGFLSFDEQGETEKVTMQFDEALYVISGELVLLVNDEYTVTGVPGDVLTIDKGATVRYAGTKETRAFLCVGPLS